MPAPLHPLMIYRLLLISLAKVRKRIQHSKLFVEIIPLTFVSTRLVGRNCLAVELESPNFAVKLNYVVIMTDYEYIIQQVKRFHFTGWDDEELRKCVDMLPGLTREQQIALFRSKWVEHEKTLKEAIFNLLFKERIEERDRKIKAMSVDELIENLRNENGYGKFIVIEMKERYDSLEDEDKMKIIDTLSETTKANKKWAEGKRKQMKSDK